MKGMNGAATSFFKAFQAELSENLEVILYQHKKHRERVKFIRTLEGEAYIARYEKCMGISPKH